MKLTTLSLAVAAACVFAQGAQAHGYHHHRYGYRQHASRHVLSQRYLEQSDYRSEEVSTDHGWHQDWDQGWEQSPSHSWDASPRRFSERRHFYRSRRAVRDDAGDKGGGDGTHDAERTDSRGGYGPRPSAWCGWEMRHLVGSDPGAQYNLARNWAHWGHAGPAGVGAVVVWQHHVGKIVGRADGEWVIESGNDGHRMRTRPRPIGSAIAIRWG